MRNIRFGLIVDHSNLCPGSGCEAPVPEFWGLCTTSLPLLPDPL